jgi:hypothetical protein
MVSRHHQAVERARAVLARNTTPQSKIPDVDEVFACYQNASPRTLAKVVAAAVDVRDAAVPPPRVQQRSVGRLIFKTKHDARVMQSTYAETFTQRFYDYVYPELVDEISDSVAAIAREHDQALAELRDETKALRAEIESVRTERAGGVTRIRGLRGSVNRAA